MKPGGQSRSRNLTAPLALVGCPGRRGTKVPASMRQARTMNVSLSPELHAFVADRLATGRFASASEVVRAGLRLLQEDERRRGAPQGAMPSSVSGEGGRTAL